MEEYRFNLLSGENEENTQANTADISAQAAGETVQAAAAPQQPAVDTSAATPQPNGTTAAASLAGAGGTTPAATNLGSRAQAPSTDAAGYAGTQQGQTASTPNGSYAFSGQQVPNNQTYTSSGAGQGTQPSGYYQSNYTQSNNNQNYYGGYYQKPYQSAAQTGQTGYNVQQRPSWSNTPSGPAQSGGSSTAGTTAIKPQKKGRIVLMAVAFLLVAALCGLGGGYLAMATMQNNGNSTVVYRAAEGTTTSRSSSVENLSVSDVASVASDSVVSITTENVVTDPFYGGQIQSGAGSGVIISEDGYIITNNHVVSGADTIVVTLHDGTDLEATLVGTDASTDIAVIKVEATGLVAAVIGDSDNLQVGDFCLAIGNPMGTLGGTVTDGIISAMNREITIDDTAMTLLQMSAAVSPGNSGGGLFNANAELIGIVNAKSSGESTEGLGFAIPVNTAIAVAQDLIENGYVTGRPALGVTVMEISTAEQALQQGVSALGVYVQEVVSGGAAAAAGMQAGDQIVSFNGVEITSSSNLSGALAEVSVGDTVQVIVARSGQRVTLEVTLQERTSA